MGERAFHDDTALARNALMAIPSDIPRDEWVRTGMAAHAAGLEFDDFDSWSATAPSYDQRAARDTWRSFKSGKGITAGTLFKLASDSGWNRSSGKPQKRPVQSACSAKEAPDQPARVLDPTEILARCEAATNAHPYIVEKHAAGVPLNNLRVVPDGDPLRIAGEVMAGALVLPLARPDGSISTLQFIPLPEVADRLKSKGKPGKLNLPGARLEGWLTVGDMVLGGETYVCEGIGTAWSCWQATGSAAVVCFGWGRVRAVAAELRQRDASARLVLVPDVGKEAEADRIAADVGASVVHMPEGWEKNSDANDLAKRDGLDALELLLSSATVPTAEFPLSVVFADELPAEYTPPDELVQGLMTAGDASVWYGDSNAGKTYLVVDLAAAVARGVPWMGRMTEPGLVVYLAAESPASVRTRLQAYQKHHGVRVPNFAIVQSPIDLFDGDADTDKVIELVRMIGAQRGQPVRLIVGDTLARLSAGANENAGQDMGLVVRRMDRIRAECKAHFLLVHHSGKSAAAGARGWSGVRAAIDTEVEITDGPAGRCAEITKQRDLSTKGERVGFRLESVTLGVTKWGSPATSCAVVATDAPDKPQGKRMGKVEGAVAELLGAHKVGIRKIEVVQHFAGRYAKSVVYRALKALVAACVVQNVAGMMALTGDAK